MTTTEPVPAKAGMVVIEHNLDVIKTADWIIDLGPEGGVRGGEIVAEGTPEAVAANPRSFTGEYLKPMLERSVGLGKTARKARIHQAAE
jgi:excinuclease UvrABC ATPase subunit